MNKLLSVEFSQAVTKPELIHGITKIPSQSDEKTRRDRSRWNEFVFAYRK